MYISIVFLQIKCKQSLNQEIWQKNKYNLFFNYKQGIKVKTADE